MAQCYPIVGAALAAGAILTMVADTMIPEAFERAADWMKDQLLGPAGTP